MPITPVLNIRGTNAVRETDGDVSHPDEVEADGAAEGKQWTECDRQIGQGDSQMLAVRVLETRPVVVDDCANPQTDQWIQHAKVEFDGNDALEQRQRECGRDCPREEYESASSWMRDWMSREPPGHLPALTAWMFNPPAGTP